jgi:hypothetical protein
LLRKVQLYTRSKPLLDPLRHRFLRLAHRRIRHVLPRFPRLQPLRICGAGPGQNGSAQAKSQRRILRVHKLQDGFCRRLWIALFNIRQMRQELLPELRVWFQKIRDL